MINVKHNKIVLNVPERWIDRLEAEERNKKITNNVKIPYYTSFRSSSKESFIIDTNVRNEIKISDYDVPYCFDGTKIFTIGK